MASVDMSIVLDSLCIIANAARFMTVFEPPRGKTNNVVSEQV